jgi:cbb3-type cytochrome oxidase subunit 3
MKKARILTYIISLAFVFSGVQIARAQTAGVDTGDYGLNETVQVGNLSNALNAKEVDSAPAGQYLSTRVGRIIGTVLSFVGVIFLILIIYAGLRWMTSAGNDKAVDEAKNLIIAAIIGLIIVLGAYAITAFIGRVLTTTG